MSLRINLNSAALTAHRNLSGTDNAMGKSIERLSSGFKINSAADDPAGLVISEKLRAQISGLGQAIRNSSDAVNMVKTAEGALNEVHTLLRSMRDLALHASNSGANDDAAIAADQAQIDSAIETLNNIAAETQFGNKKLLDGSAGVKSTILGTSVASADLTNSGLAATTNVRLSVTTAAAKAAYTFADLSGGLNGGAAGEIEINGVTVAWGAGTNAAALEGLINDVADETGVVAVNVAGVITLTSKEYGSEAKILITGTDADAVTAGGETSAAAIGTDVIATIDDGAGNPVGGTWTGAGLKLTDDLGNTIMLTEAGGTVPGVHANEIRAEVGTLTFQVGAYADQTRTLSLQSTAAAYLGIGVAGSTANVAQIDVNTPAGAREAILVLDEAISQLSGIRAELGAFQKNVLESNINSLTIAKENIAASESTIRDTDMAAEMVNMTRNQIMNQAGVAMLAQANQAPQNLLSLLK